MPPGWLVSRISNRSWDSHRDSEAEWVLLPFAGAPAAAGAAAAGVSGGNSLLLSLGGAKGVERRMWALLWGWCGVESRGRRARDVVLSLRFFILRGVVSEAGGAR